MGSEQIELEVDVSVGPSGCCLDKLLDVLGGGDAEDYLYDLLCSWLWRYMPPDTAGFKLIVTVAIER